MAKRKRTFYDLINIMNTKDTPFLKGCIFIFLFIVFNATFSNISAISWRPVLVVEEAGIQEENHRP